MKRFILLSLLAIFISKDVFSQASVEAQIGGANFIGITLNSRYSISLSKTKEHKLSPSFGIGTLAPWWDAPTAIMNIGITYHYKSWGIGTEVSGFAAAPFVNSNRPHDFVDMIVYPNMNYTFKYVSNWYLRLSAGAYFAYSKSNDPQSDGGRLRFEGDVIPGAGVAVGRIIQ